MLLPWQFNLEVFKRGWSMIPRNFVYISCKVKQQESLECNTLIDTVQKAYGATLN